MSATSSQTEQLPLFCKDCKYRRWVLGLHPDYDRCSAPQNLREEWNLVSGEKEVFAHTAKIARAFDNYCGSEGKWFSPRASLVYTTNLFTSEEPKKILSRSLKHVSASDLGLG